MASLFRTETLLGVDFEGSVWSFWGGLTINFLFNVGSQKSEFDNIDK
jgi:hypothetical protein